jgi:hypothetical protein
MNGLETDLSFVFMSLGTHEVLYRLANKENQRE